MAETGKLNLYTEDRPDMETNYSETKRKIMHRIVCLMADNPSFVHFLKGRGLTRIEIMICCMIVLGYSVKFISIEYSDARIYHKTGEIKNKIVMPGSLKQVLDKIYDNCMLSENAVNPE